MTGLRFIEGSVALFEISKCHGFTGSWGSRGSRARSWAQGLAGLTGLDRARIFQSRLVLLVPPRHHQIL